MRDLLVTLMNVQPSIILVLENNTKKLKKMFVCAKDESAIELSIVTRWLKIFCLDGKNFDDQARSGKPKTEDIFMATLQDIEANPMSITMIIRRGLTSDCPVWFVSLQDISKSNRRCRIVPHVTKIISCLNF